MAEKRGAVICDTLSFSMNEMWYQGEQGRRGGNVKLLLASFSALGKVGDKWWVRVEGEKGTGMISDEQRFLLQRS